MACDWWSGLRELRVSVGSFRFSWGLRQDSPTLEGLVPNLGTTYTGVDDMRVIARSTLSRFIGTLAGRKDRAAVKAALDAWYYEVKSAAWSSPAEVKRAYANASIIGSERVVFNIKGNSYRLVAAVDYQRQAVFIKWLGSHADYDRIDVRTVQYGDQTY